MTDAEKIVERFIALHSLISPKEKILVAFSGGPDSAALLHILCRLAKKSDFKLCACYVNHNIRPKESRKESAFCSEICARLNIPLIIVEGDVPRYARDMRLSLEQCARDFRYASLENVAEKEKCRKIALGHHQDDIVETILFRLFRGTGPAGLWPIKPISGKLIRPMSELTRKDILSYLKQNKIPYMIDSSNLKSDFSRNFIRNEAIPIIEKGFGDKFRKGIIKFGKILREEDLYLRQLAERKFRRIAEITPGGKIVIDLKGLANYDLWLRRRIIKISLEKISNRPGEGAFEEVERVDNMLEGDQKAVNLQNGIRVFKERDNIVLAAKRPPMRPLPLPINGKAVLKEVKAAVSCRAFWTDNALPMRNKKGSKVAMDFDKLSPPLSIRGIRPGDKFTPLGMKGNKKIGDFLTDRKIPIFLRDEIPLIEDQKGIIWLVGYQIAERVKIDNNTANILEIELLRGKRHGKAEI
jgi:tRNA(Ile)-lysidine synthase